MSDPLFVNKIMFAGLAAILLVAGLPQLTTALFSDGHHGHGELHLAYPIEFETSAGGAEGGGAPQISFAQLLTEASASAGERRAGLCKSCHSFEKGGANGAGPNLWGIVGRDIAGVAGFGYTAALQGADGAWTYDKLNQYLENSQNYISGTAMVQRIGKEQHRAEIIAYLRSLADTPEPLPAVEVEEASLDAADQSQVADNSH